MRDSPSKDELRSNGVLLYPRGMPSSDPSPSKPVWQSWTFWAALGKILIGVLVSAGVIPPDTVNSTTWGNLFTASALGDIALRARTSTPVHFS